jgi:hypothetical protein
VAGRRFTPPVDVGSETLVFKEFDAIPSTKALTSYRTSAFEVTAQYATPAQLPKGVATHIGPSVVGPCAGASVLVC